MDGLVKKHTRQTETILQNAEAIGSMARESLEKRSRSARIGDYIATQAGRIWFINLHVVWFGLWILFNTAAPRHLVFDSFPFPLLTMVVSLEAIFLSLFVLMSQTRNGMLAEERNHLDLQVNLLSEQENTKMLQMLRALCQHHQLPISEDPELVELLNKTDPRDVVAAIKRALPDI